MSDNHEQETIVPYDSNQAASIQSVTGWVSRLGRFFGNDEHMARSQGCTHIKCDSCQMMTPYVGHKICPVCQKTEEIKSWQARPKREWGAIIPLYSEDKDVIFITSDGLEDFCHDNGVTPESLMLVICDPIYLEEIDPYEHYCDDLPEGEDLPSEIEDAFDALNEAIRKYRTPISWRPGKFAPTDESVIRAIGGTNGR